MHAAAQLVESISPGAKYYVSSSHTTEDIGVTHIYLRQLVNGLEIANADMNINVDKNGKVISYGSTFVSDAADAISGGGGQSSHRRMSPRGLIRGVKSFVSRNLFGEVDSNEYPESMMDPEDALISLAKHLQEPHIPSKQSVEVESSATLHQSGAPQFTLLNTGITTGNKPVPVFPAFIHTDKGELRQAWDLRVEQDDHWYHALTGHVLQLIDWVSDAIYHVYPLGTNDPHDGERQYVVDPADHDASPLGWHNTGRASSTKTQGNNVYAQENWAGMYDWENNYRSDGGKDLVFDFKVDLGQEPREYADAAITNLFYWNNAIHDLFYKYGFNEQSGNFQENNFGRGGQENDGVIANAQDGSGYSNANFATPPDGQHGKMRMYVWSQTQPFRDGDLEGGIIMHEYAHGISTRLTGGPANSGCLGWGEAGGMGEGWGDFFATVLRVTPQMNRNTDFEMGSYSNGGHGIRRYPYSTSKGKNPHSYKVLDNPSYWGVHAIGEVWAEMLYEVFWNLVDKHGFTTDVRSADISHGNTLALQLVIDGMKLQPCRPSFVAARDAILLADRQRTGGQNQCLIWAGFAKRGLGKGAVLRDRLDARRVPCLQP
ncbi:hypothetical protein GQ42DRAFT_166395 [Ramicandelaber brevisporus]|nr:hypothetical protein GQ42DRAFT_166395 [Ramicandelaber brevisporus]